MSRDAPQITAAKVEAERARGRLMETAQQLQVRLSPRTLARDAWEGAKGKSADFAEGAVDAVRKRPIAVTGVVAAIALFLAREPLKDLAEKLVDNVSGKEPDKRSKSSKSKTEKVE